MKFATLECIAAILVTLLVIPVQLAAQETAKQNRHHKFHHYQLIDVGTFGGPNTNFFTNGQAAQILNNRGAVTGTADTSVPDPNAPNCLQYDCFISHTFIWQKGSLTDLGALPGINGSFGGWITPNGLVAGISENGEIDPLIGTPEIRAVFWRDGQIIDLGTFGGNESFASAVNSRGQVVGSALNAILDPFDTAPYLYSWGTQMRAFLWQKGVMRDLGTLGGPDSVAGLVNEAGQVAGFSYTSYIPDPANGGTPPVHPFLWENGKMRDLGTIGGTQVFQLNALNERGQVVGSMTLADEDPNHVHPFLWDGRTLLNLGAFGGNEGEADWLNDAGEVVGHAATPNLCPGAGAIDHAFLWRNGVMRDLGIVPGIDPLQGASGATGINSKTQVVGESSSCDFSIDDAFLWENGSMADLNTLIPPDSIMHLFWAAYINDRGEITGFGFLPDGDVHTFLLIPCDENHSDVGACDYSLINAATATASVSPAPTMLNLTAVSHDTPMRRLVRKQLGPRFHIPGLQSPTK